MCGLAGYALLPDAAPVADHVIERMNATLVHRGPDGGGVWRAGRTVLGHRRLSIVDLAHGAQPMVRGTAGIAFNGEIYGHADMRRRLAPSDTVWEGHGDTETLLVCLRHDWRATLEQARGMYAFAFHDGDTLLLARDPLGIKPLYWTETKRGIAFASELKALLEFPDVRREVDPRAVEEFLALGYVAGERTILRGVHKLPAGHYLRWQDGRREVAAFWDLPAPPHSDDLPADAEERLLAALEESVSAHLMSDVPIGAFLSGGVDSSAVVAMAARHHEHLVTCGVGFDEAEVDESRFAAEVAGLFGTEHHSRTTRAGEIADLELLATHYDEPFGDASALPTYHLCRMAREHLTVCLSGDGGDESFLGYRRHRFDAAENRVREFVPRTLRKPVFGMLGSVYPKLDWAPRVLRARTTFQNLARDPAGAYFHSLCRFRERRSVMSGDLIDALDGYSAEEVFRHHHARAPGRTAIEKTQYVDFKTYLVDDILTKVDRASMAVSLEVRTPMIDVRFVEHAMRLPTSAKLRDGEGKWLLRRAFRRLLPDRVLDRPKQGFVLPLREWLRGPLRERFADLLLEPHDLFDAAQVALLWDAHQSGRRDHSQALWMLGVHRLWERRWLHG